MATRPARRVPPVSIVSLPRSGGESAGGSQRALSELESVLNRDASEGVAGRIDLVVGRNRIPNALGRRAVAVFVSPTVADAGWAYAYNPNDGNPAPHREVWIDVIGVDQPGAYVVIK